MSGRGSIRRRGRDSWQVRVELDRGADGRRRQVQETIRGKRADANDRLTELMDSLRRSVYVEPTKETVDQHLKAWVATERQNLATKTFVRYQEIVERHLCPAFEGVRLQVLGAGQIEAYYAAALESGRLDGKGGLSAQTMLHHHRILKKGLQAAVRWRKIDRNPADDVAAPRPRGREIRVLDRQAKDALLAAAAGTELYAPVFLTLATGLRRGELLALKWSDIDIDAGRLSVNRTIEQTRAYGVAVKTPKTRRSRRTVRLPAQAVKVLRRHRVAQKKLRLLAGEGFRDAGWVFARHTGSHWTPDVFTGAWRALVRRSGIGHVRFHDLRHTHATQLLAAGVNAKVVSERLGHSSVAFTLDTYSHVLPDMQDQAADAIAAFL